MPNSKIINKGKLYDRVLSKILRKMSAGGILLLNNDGLRIAEKTCGSINPEGIWGSANHLILAGERASAELHNTKNQFVNQIFESEECYLIAGHASQDISYAILSSKVNKISLGMLKLFADNLKEQVNQIDS